jgi:RNA polymerase sigma-70 factor (ECF subfamily)
MALGDHQDLLALSDEQLLAQSRQGSGRAYEVLVERYRQELYHYLARMLSNRSLAEDVFQDTFLQVFLSIDRFDPDRRFRPWLFTIATNKARDQLRRNKRRDMASISTPLSSEKGQERTYVDLLESDVQMPVELVEGEETRQQVREMVDALPQAMREVLLLAYFHGFSYKQIAEMLDIPLGTVKSRLHSAVGTFADRWGRLIRKTKS